MKVTIKTLKGGKFEVEAEPSSTIAEVKAIIVSAKIREQRQGCRLRRTTQCIKISLKPFSLGDADFPFLISHACNNLGSLQGRTFRGKHEVNSFRKGFA